ncbi:unnamed protein product [Symbiodinium sp. CCMP2456]|nr:unnamed protein product [Symbiodinium sp. CCMP2456]
MEMSSALVTALCSWLKTFICLTWVGERARVFATITASCIFFLAKVGSRISQIPSPQRGATSQPNSKLPPELTASAWYLFMGVVEGISPDSRRNERGVLRVPSLGLRVSLPWHCLGDPPETDSAGRYPRSWLQEFLHSVPKDLEEKGVSTQATLLAPSFSSWGHEWEGRGVAAQDVPPYNIRPDCLRQLTSMPEMTLLPHEDGRVMRAEGEGNQPRPEFGSPPRPPPVEPTLLLDAYRTAKEQVSSNGEADPLDWGSKTLGQLGENLGDLVDLMVTRLAIPCTGPNSRSLLRKAGANFGDLAATSDPGLATDRISHAIDGLRKAQDEDKTGTKGQLSALKEGEKLDVFLARGCGQLSIELCKGVYGKELFHSIKRAGHHAKHSLGLIKWPVLITNRVALSIAGLWWGGSESFTLLAADCVTARTEQVEAWGPPTEHKIEARAKSPSTFLSWLRYAENAVRVFGIGSAYGLEHVQERMKFLKALQEAHEEDEHAFPFKYCMDLYEELSAVWCEEIRERRRQLCAKLGTENPRLEDLKLLALAPGPDGSPKFQFPRVWDLSDPSGYYQRVILPRQDRAMARLLNKQLHDHVTRDRRPDNRTTAGPEEREGATGVPPDTDEGKSGRAPRLALPAEDQKTGVAGGAGEKAYPAGKRLTPTEVKRSITHAPVCQKSKKPICWDAACHIGCQRADCPHAHEPLPAMNKLDYSVAMQVLRRGGLKNGAKINPKDVDGRVAQLRSQAKEDHDSKVEPGATAQGKAKPKAKAKAKEKAGWAVPDDDQGPVNHLEEELGDLAQGPDHSRHDSFRKDAEPVSSPGR